MCIRDRKGDAQISPYELGTKNACTYCPYISVCGFDRKIPGYGFRRLKSFSDEELWKSLGESMDAVSYTHLDVYKRQPLHWEGFLQAEL